MCPHVHLPLCVLPGRQRSTAGGALLGPCRVLPQAEQKAKEEISCQVFIPRSPLGARAGFPRVLWYCVLWWLCRVNRSLCSSGPWFSTVLNLHGYINIILGILDVSVTICVLQRLLNISAAESPHMVQEGGVFGGVMVALYPGKTP